MLENLMNDYSKTVNWRIDYKSTDNAITEEFCERFIRNYPDFVKVKDEKTGECWLETDEHCFDDIPTLDVIMRLRAIIGENLHFKAHMISLNIESRMVIVESSDCTHLFV